MTSFADLKIKKNIVEVLKRIKIVKPTKVQQEAIPIILDGHDCIVQAKTGTGKTYAYTIPNLQKINPKHGLQMIVIVPTRELAYQVKEDILKIAEPLGMKVAVFTGGKPRQSDGNILRRKNQIVVGTPGRIKDYLNNKLLRFSELKWMILDETDKIMEVGFFKDTDYLLSRTPKLCQKLLFSATQDERIMELLDVHFREYAEIIVHDKLISENLKQYAIHVPNTQKKETLLNILKKEKKNKVVIFANKRSVVDYLTKYLSKEGYKTKAMHGDFTSMQRKNLFFLFRHNKIKILVATDVASRGLHSQNIQLIINYDLPRGEPDYVHRVGRTARMNSKGVAISLVCPEDEKRQKAIQNYTGDTMEEYEF